MIDYLVLFISILAIWFIVTIKGNKKQVNRYVYSCIAIIILYFFVKPRLLLVNKFYDCCGNDIILLLLIILIGYIIRWTIRYTFPTLFKSSITDSQSKK